ncbi:MAG: roadblock/LC7 domain-containing protein [Candidatus Thiodiazotropha sp. (ex Myrtea sp. 'scaly one' KF741663)]|nr:roadblock/LC7 domain-containing protein [Candidatus Thiodiazotropha sp. (ex Myrtea sp. 'scaly one' KF741663)]
MSEYQLVEDFYLLPTTAGAFYAVSGKEDEPIRRLMLVLLKQESSLQVDAESLCQWLNISDEQEALAILHRAQTLSLIQGFREPQQVSGLGVGHKLQDILPHLSSTGKGLLVDWSGLSLAHSGLNDTTADMLSALSADLIAVQTRHAERLSENLGLGAQGWAAVDAHGSSRIGAWPLFVGDENFLLVLLGEPRLNQPEFISLVWVLINRYG